MRRTNIAGILVLAVIMVLLSGCLGETEAEKFAIDSSGPFQFGSISVIKEAAKGDKVTITAQPDNYCGLSSIAVKGTNTNEPFDLSGTGTEWTFTMPGEPVKITAVFLEKKQIEIGKQYDRGDLEFEGREKVYFAMPGETVTIYGKPYEGYYLHTLRVEKVRSVEEGEEKEVPNNIVDGNLNIRTFVMIDEPLWTPHGNPMAPETSGAIFKLIGEE